MDHDDGYFNFNPEVSRHRSKLRVLYHAVTCPSDELSFCSAGVVHCCASKRLFAHIITCTAGNDCDVPGCQHSRRVLRHDRKCGRNGESYLVANTDSSSNRNCDICSAVPIIHDASTICKRFRTATSFSVCARMGTTRDTRNATTGENATVDVNFVEVAIFNNIQTKGGREQYDRLPVCRKRNLLHSQQQQRHQNNLPLQEKENILSLTDFTRPDNEMKNSREGSSGRSPLHASKGSQSCSVHQYRAVNPDQNMCKSDNFDKSSVCWISSSATAHHQLGVLGDEASGLSRRATSSALPIQLPAHPRDSKRRSRSVLKPITRRSSHRTVQHIDPFNTSNN